MVSPGVNVLRWSALGLGVVYGVYHQRSIRSHDKEVREKREFAQRERLISQAKAEFANKSAPKADEADAVVSGQPQ